jgi:mono/diheme cytochrome c family protein
MSKIFKILLYLVSALLLLVIVGAIAIYGLSERKINQTYSTPTDNIAIPADAASIARGKYLASTVSVCVDCHGANMAGAVPVDDPDLGRIVATNLTKGKQGIGNLRSDAELARAIRYGVSKEGKSLRIMPSDDYYNLSDKDLGAIVAYVRSLPPTDSTLPENEFRPLGRILTALGQLDIFVADRIDQKKPRQKDADNLSALDKGRYLADISGCTGCHGPGLSGGQIPGAPPDFPKAVNITPAGNFGKWSEADFINTIRTGKSPEGKVLSEEMPWKSYRNMSDDELKAIYLFIKSVPPKPFGNR